MKDPLPPADDLASALEQAIAPLEPSVPEDPLPAAAAAAEPTPAWLVDEPAAALARPVDALDWLVGPASEQTAPVLETAVLPTGALDWLVAPERMPPSITPAGPDGFGKFLSQYAAQAPRDLSRPVRDYQVREVSIIFAVCAALLVILDSEGLMTWAQRMDLGPAQSAWRAVLAPINTAMDRSGLTLPRRWLVGSGAWVGRVLGAGEDPVLAEGWDPPVEPEVPSAPVPPAPAEASVAPIVEPLAAEPAPLPVVPVKAPGIPVLLMGDSMIAGSLATSLTRALASDPRLHVVHAFQTATGLSRPDVYDWMKVLPPLLEREHPRLVVCSLGANDVSRIDDGDRALEFGEAGWRSAYAARVVELMRALTGSGAQVLWLGLPPMRAGKFSAHAQVLNGIFAESAKKVPGVEFLELRMLVSDSAGEYATFVRAPDGRLVRFRLDDGIHYAPAAARSITRWVVDWLYERYRKLPY